MLIEYIYEKGERAWKIRFYQWSLGGRSSIITWPDQSRHRVQLHVAISHISLATVVTEHKWWIWLKVQKPRNHKVKIAYKHQPNLYDQKLETLVMIWFDVFGPI